MREYGDCPWGCGRRVSLTRGFPMPHNRAPGTRCRPPEGWSPLPVAEPEPTRVVGAGCGERDGRRECGGTLPAKVRAPVGWLCLLVGGDNGPKRWFCSTECLGRAHRELARLADRAEPDLLLMPSLELLNRVAGGERLTVMTATPPRVRRKLEQAFARVVAEVDEQARRDARGRPTTAVLLAEALHETIQTATCSRCRLERPVADFPADPARPAGVTSWCKPCESEARRERDPDAVPA